MEDTKTTTGDLKPEEPDTTPMAVSGLEMSTKWGKLMKALGKAQKAIGSGPKKTSTNPHFHSQYADLAEVIGAVKSALLDAGIVVTHGSEMFEIPGKEGRVAVTTMLCHPESEQWVTNTITMDARDRGPQAVGAAITYGRRYNYLALVDLAPEDDDGNAASPPPKRPSPMPRKAAAAKASVAKDKADNEPPHPAEGKPTGHDGAVCVPFGKKMGTPITTLDDESLGWYIKRAHANVDSPDYQEGGDKHRFAAKEIAWRDALEIEFNRRNGGVEEDPPNPDLLGL